MAPSHTGKMKRCCFLAGVLMLSTLTAPAWAYNDESPISDFIRRVGFVSVLFADAMVLAFLVAIAWILWRLGRRLFGR